MRKADSFIAELDIVAQVNGKIVGNIVYTKAKILDDSGVNHNVITFGPISVLPAFQGKGIGSNLIEHTKKRQKNLVTKRYLYMAILTIIRDLALSLQKNIKFVHRTICMQLHYRQ